MLKLVIVCSFLLTFSVYSQKENNKLDSINMPVSIFIIDGYGNQEFNQRIGNYLPLTGFKFMINASVIDNYFQVDIRNIGRKITMDDINDNYQKAELNKYFFTGYDLRKIVWNRP
jgi:hypothetical protein